MSTPTGFFKSTRDSRLPSKVQSAKMSRPLVNVLKSALIRSRKKQEDPSKVPLSDLSGNSNPTSIQPKIRNSVTEEIKEILRQSKIEKPPGPFNTNNLWKLRKDNLIIDDKPLSRVLAGCDNFTSTIRSIDNERKVANSKDLFRLMKKNLVDSSRPNIKRLTEKQTDGIQNYRACFMKKLISGQLQTLQTEKKTSDRFILRSGIASPFRENSSELLVRRKRNLSSPQRSYDSSDVASFVFKQPLKVKMLFGSAERKKIDASLIIQNCVSRLKDRSSFFQ